jgi:hypothetical protein
MSDCTRSSAGGGGIGYIEYLQIVTTNNYIIIALYLTTARTKSSQSAVSSPVVAW